MLLNNLPYLRTARRIYYERATNARLDRIYRRFQEYTMLPPADYANTMRLAGLVEAVAGCVIECGVWKGGVAAGLASILGADRKYILFDSFEGLPPAEEIDGVAALRWQTDTNGSSYYDNCRAPADFVKNAMHLAGVKDAQIIPGWFNDTLTNFTPEEPIAFLHLDCDWYASTMVCLENLYSHVAPKGIIVVDDYYVWDGCSRAVHDFLSRQISRDRIKSLGSMCYIQRALGNSE